MPGRRHGRRSERDVGPRRKRAGGSFPDGGGDEGAALIGTCRTALQAAREHLRAVTEAVAAQVAPGGRIDAAALNARQHEAHGLAWTATYVAALRALLEWAERLQAASALGTVERLILHAGFAEYLAQLGGGLAMNQGETSRPADFGLDGAGLLASPAVATLIAAGGRTLRARIAACLAQGQFGAPCHGDEVLHIMAEQFRRFAAERVAPDAHAWHLADAYIRSM